MTGSTRGNQADDNDQMSPQHASDEWTALDPSTRREALAALKVRLRGSPDDQATRREIVDAYRQLGNPDQAGRFAIGLDEGARPSEVRAYAWMVRGLRSGESAVRRLSIISTDIELPDRVKQAIDGRPMDGEWRSGGPFVFTAWAIWAGLSVVSMAAVFGFAMAGARDVQSIAQRSTTISGWTLVLALLSTTVWCAASKKWKPALVWACITIVVVGIVLAASAAVLR